MDGRHEYEEEPYGFDERSLEEQLAALDALRTGELAPPEPAGPGETLWHAEPRGSTPVGPPAGGERPARPAGPPPQQTSSPPTPPPWPSQLPPPFAQSGPQPPAYDPGPQGHDHESAGQASPDRAAHERTSYERGPYDQGRRDYGPPVQGPHDRGAHDPEPHAQAPYGHVPADRGSHDQAGPRDQALPDQGLGLFAPPSPSAAPTQQPTPPAREQYPPPGPYPPPEQYAPAEQYPPQGQPRTREQYPPPDQYPPQEQYPPRQPPSQGPPGPPPPAQRQQAYQQPYPQEQPQAPETAESLNADTLLRGRRRAPSGGWRRVVYRASGGIIHPGESAAELRRRELIARARTPVASGHHRVAVLSLKGGVGKTTTTVGLGSTLASLRGDRVIAIDANPDRGTLSDKVRLETAATVRDLLNERGTVQRYSDVRAFTSQSPSRLEVLASDRDPAASQAFSEEDYRAVANVLEHFYSICITDCGTGLLHSAMAGVLGLADQIILVSSPSVDGARSASATLDWLEAHGYGALVRTATVVLSSVRPGGKSTVDLTRLEQHFATRCGTVVRVPYDPHLEEGAEVELDRLKPATREAYLLLAAAVADGFGRRR